MIRAYFRRGAHRANRFSVRVADIAARLKRERERRERQDWREYVDDKGRVWVEWRGALTVYGADANASFLVVAPPGSSEGFPALFEGEVVADA